MLPLFKPGEDPGPSFIDLVRRTAPQAAPLPFGGELGPSGENAGGRLDGLNISHATTVVAVRYVDGVVMAGDRRATSGNLISYRDMEKVFPADRYSGVSIAGAAGPAIEMVKLFQLQLEHYEKVEGQALSLEGKANQLGSMVRANLPMAMQGMVVVPLFAGYDVRRGTGRLFEYDVTGGRYEDRAYATSGSGSLFAGTVVKIGYRADMSRSDAVDLAISSLWQAADSDSATGGPDPIRGIYPIVATISADGFNRLEEVEVRERFEEVIRRLNEHTAGPSADVAAGAQS